MQREQIGREDRKRERERKEQSNTKIEEIRGEGDLSEEEMKRIKEKEDHKQ